MLKAPKRLWKSVMASDGQRGSHLPQKGERKNFSYSVSQTQFCPKSSHGRVHATKYIFLQWDTGPFPFRKINVMVKIGETSWVHEVVGTSVILCLFTVLVHQHMAVWLAWVTHLLLLWLVFLQPASSAGQVIPSPQCQKWDYWREPSCNKQEWP